VVQQDAEDTIPFTFSNRDYDSGRGKQEKRDRVPFTADEEEVESLSDIKIS